MGEATTGSEAVALVRSATPDMVLMDIRMPGMGGIEATRRIVGAGSPSRILVLTTFDLDHHVTAGERLVAPAVADRLIRRFLAAAPTAAPPSRFSALSARELDVFVLVARGMSNDEIAQVVELVYADVDESLWPAAEWSVEAQLAHLRS